MSAFLDILNLLSGPPGGMVYYLILLFSIWAIVGLALSRWSRGERRGLVPRLLLAGALMSFSRFLLIVVALLDRQNGTSLVRFGPPLERFVDALSGLLICWAFVLPHRKRTISHLSLGVMGFFSLGLYVIAATQWASALHADETTFYNLSWQRWIWELWQLGFLIPALVYLLVAPAQERVALSISLGILVVGHLLQAVFPLTEQIPHFAGWTRFANLLAFPLVGVSTYRLIIERFDAQTADLQAVNQESLSQIAGLMALLDSNVQMSSSLDLDAVLENAARGISQVLRSDLCAFALFPQDANDRSMSPASAEMELAIVYDAPHAIWKRTRFRTEDYPAIQYAVTRNKPAVLSSRRPAGRISPETPGADEQMTQLYRLLGSQRGGPLIVQPLERASTTIGVLLVCRPSASSAFTSAEVRKCRTLATHVIAAIENARIYQGAKERVDHLVAELGALETEYTRVRADLENRLEKSKEQATLYEKKLYEAELSEKQARQDTAQAHQRLAKLRQENQTEIAYARDEVKRSIQQAAHLTQQIAELENVVQALEQEKGLLQLRLAMASTEQADFVPDLQEPSSEQVPAQAGSQGEVAGMPRPAQVADEQVHARDAFLASLAQDLRTPMTSILGYTELLMNESLGELEGRQRKLLQRIQANIERMERMLDDLIGVTTIDSGKLMLKPVPVDLTSVIGTALQRAKFRLEEKELKTRLKIGALPMIHADAEYIQQIVDNLLSNSCKSSVSGGTIGIQAHVEKGDAGESHLHVAVSDSGGGIAPWDQARVFERFHRADQPLVAGLGETGVGLALVKTLVEAHQGQVWCESELGVGTTFHFTIPVGSGREAARGRNRRP